MLHPPDEGPIEGEIFTNTAAAGIRHQRDRITAIVWVTSGQLHGICRSGIQELAVVSKSRNVFGKVVDQRAVGIDMTRRWVMVVTEPKRVAGRRL
jgi:hypothetical protein